MDRLYRGVCYAGIDTDPELKYPKGAGRVAFSNQQSYIAAISARFVQLQHNEIDKRVSAGRLVVVPGAGHSHPTPFNHYIELVARCTLVIISAAAVMCAEWNFPFFCIQDVLFGGTLNCTVMWLINDGVYNMPPTPSGVFRASRKVELKELIPVSDNYYY